MKNKAQFKLSSVLTNLTTIFSICLLTAANGLAQEATNKAEFPVLSGEKAIEYLKQNGDYESFADAFALSQKDENASGADSLTRSMSQRKRLVANDAQISDSFGTSVSISGNTIVVGAPSNEFATPSTNGAAYIFVRSGTNWVQEAKLLASDGQFRDWFGASVSISGNTVVIGAPLDDIGTNTDQGSAYVFVRSGTTWNFLEKLTNSFNAAGDNYGRSVAIDNNTIVIGAPNASSGSNMFGGRAYIYERTSTFFDIKASLFANEPGAQDRFGSAVAVNGNTIVVTSPYDSREYEFQGSAHVYSRVNNNWNFQQIISMPIAPSQQVSYSYFGTSVSISGQYIAVGALTANRVNGSALVFVKNGSTWNNQVWIEGETPNQFGFGTTLSISGNTLVVGSESSDDYRGAVSLYSRVGTNWIKKQRIAIPNASANTRFGASVSISGGTAVFGMPSDTVTQSGQGTAYVYQQSPAAFNFDGDGADDISVFRSGNWYLNNSTNGFTAVQFGLNTDRLAPGDFNGDGISDVSVYRNGFWYRIRSGDNVFVQNQFGASTDVPVSGDFNGNGTSDVAVFRPSNGTWYWLLPTLQAGSATFGAAGDKPVPADFDGDGTTDVSVFRPSNGNWYWLNSSNGQFRAVAFGQNGDVPLVGDYDGDGRADQAVFRPANGTWYLLGSTAGFSSVQWGISTDTPVAADYDGDGKTDVAIFRNGLWVILRSSGGVTQQQFGTTGDRPVPAAFVQ
jgi:hypothetical protein